MRIAYLAASQFPSRAANSVHVVKMCSALAAAGHEVTLFAWKQNGVVPNIFSDFGVPQNFEIVLVPRRSNRIFGLIQFYRIFRARSADRHPSDFDLIYARHRLLLFVLRNFGSNLVFEAHSPPQTISAKLVELALLRHKRLSAVVVISRALRLKYEENLPPRYAEKLFVAHDAASRQSFDVMCSARELSELDRPIIGYLGHLYKGKGMEIICRLAPLLTSCDFVIAGGEPNDILYWKAKCTSKNVFFLGHLPHFQLTETLKRFDIVVAPYQERVSVAGSKGDVARWMSPLKLFEYMAAGKPIVCSDLPVIREILTDRVNARLVAATDVDAWREAITELIQTRSIRQRLGFTAFADFNSKHTWEKRSQMILAAVTERRANK